MGVQIPPSAPGSTHREAPSGASSLANSLRDTERSGSALLNAGYNFRDLGGLPTEDGRVTAHGVLFRGAALHDCGLDEAALLRDRLGIRSVIDLRTADEVAAQGGTSAGAWGVRCVSLPVLTPPLPPAGPADLGERYLAYLERSTPSIAGVLHRVARDDQRPVAIHCTSGKDRTGVVTALLLRLVGVTLDALARDYAATAPNVASVLERLGRSGPRPLRAVEIPPGILDAEERTIRTFVETFEARHGTVCRWATDHGVRPCEVEAICTAFIRPIR